MSLSYGSEEIWDILALLHLLNFAINSLTKLQAPVAYLIQGQLISYHLFADLLQFHSVMILMQRYSSIHLPPDPVSIPVPPAHLHPTWW
jgi:hypothetical protein